MTTGWTERAFEDCIDKVVYPRKIQRKEFLSDGAFPIVSQESDFINGYWNDSQVLFNVDKPVIIFGDHTKIIKYVDFDFVLGADGVKILAPKLFLNTKFVYYYLLAHPIQTLGYARHYRLLKDIKVLFPTLSEQRRIVTILDEAFAGLEAMRANAEKNVQNARELFDSYLISVLRDGGPGWTEKTLRAISTEFGRGKSRHRPRGDPSLLGGKYPFIQTGDVANSNHLIVEHSQTYNEAGLAQSKLWPKGTVCIAIVGANVAETAILGFDACFPDSVIGIVVDEKQADSEYVEFLLQTYKSELKERGKGTARDNINLATFETHAFPFPPIRQQKGIVARIKDLSERTQNLESVYRQKLAAISELKQSLLQKAFSGQLTSSETIAA